jgi:uncharacterized protein YdeI (YjbR/CyaY-like superfamily)
VPYEGKTKINAVRLMRKIRDGISDEIKDMSYEQEREYISRDLNLVYAKDREEWRSWLEKNHDSVSEIWLVFYKKTSSKPTVTYDESVEEALCFGWVDGMVKTIDEERYKQRFTPRSKKSNWSASNIERVTRLIEQGRMTDAGRAKLPQDLTPPPPRYEADSPVPDWFTAGLSANPAAAANFQKLAPSHRKNYVRWVTEAKKEETRQRRLAEAIRMLERNEKPGMK